jgi:hypothetical protein
MSIERAIIGWPSARAQAVFSTAAGGSWRAAWPLANMKVLPMSLVARSTTAAAVDTRFQVSFASPTPVQMLGLIGHNCSIAATMRYRLYGDSAMTELLHDTGDVEVWPRVYPFGTLDWYDPRWWNGKWSAAQIAQYNACTPLWLARRYRVKAIDVTIIDPANPDGYVQIGLFEPAEGWQFSTNPDVGAEYGFRARSKVVEALGGTEDYARFAAPRDWTGQISYLERNEALARGFDFIRDADLTEPFIWMPRPANPDDPRAKEHLLRTCFFARNVEMPRFRYVTPLTHDSMTLNLKEVL